MMKTMINREISWLTFNERVLQEAEDSSVPLLERLKFLGIYSNNQDEFFRVRVATIRRMVVLEKEAKKDLGIKPSNLLEEIQSKLMALQKRFDACYLKLLKELKKEHIFIVNENELSDEQGEFVKDFFHDHVRLHIFPIMVDELKKFPVLYDASIYLAVRFYKNGQDESVHKHAMLEVPTEILPRFVVLPESGGNNYVMFLDDIIRHNLAEIFKIYDFDHIEAYTIKFTRDAELDIDNDVSKSFLSAVETSIKKRKKADALRFIYDEEMHPAFLKFLTKKMNLKKQDSVIPGVRYHNFKDFMSFPNFGRKELVENKELPLNHPEFVGQRSLLTAIKEKDKLLYYPYHSFDHFLDLLREAAIDPKVSHIRMNIYRVASDSNVIKSLITAVKNGKFVTVLVEIRARFDEEANIFWVNKLREEGVRVITGVKGLKVHSKLCLITRRESGKKIYYGTIGTGNFHEGTAKVYTDFQLFTCNQVLTKEIRELFTFFDINYSIPQHHRLLTAPFNLRSKINNLINKEIRMAKSGKKGEIFMKMNSLVDLDIIKRLYSASKAGVKVKLIVRGICSLIPGINRVSENIEAISIVDKYLEHARVFIFHNGGKPQTFIGSADLMTRNLDYRVEVVTPILDKSIAKEIRQIMDIQWSDNVKARVFDKKQINEYKVKNSKKDKAIRSQDEIFDYFKTQKNEV